MQLQSFRVRMYKRVLDSGDVRVTPLTVIVGKNEAGKTSLLRALQKLNPAVEDPYLIDSEWPRGHRGSRDPNHIVCAATFLLDDADRAAIGEGHENTQTVTVGRTYSGDKKVLDPEVATETATALWDRIPKCVYMDNYEYFSGRAKLDQVATRLAQGSPSPEDKAINTLLSLANLDIKRLVAAVQEGKTEDRRYDLADGSATITRQMASHWKQSPYEVELDADGMDFFTFVKKPGEQIRIKLEERSRGFQWFFSFDAKLLRETNGELKNCIILLDEPGLHLHASAQKDLLSRLEEYAQGNCMIYSTHLPFMINLHEPDRIRVIDEAAEGVAVGEQLSSTTPEGRFTLQAALGMNSRVGMPLGDRNLIIEGVHDYWIIMALSNLAQRCGKKSLPADCVASAAGGAQEATYLATFMIGQSIAPVVLYDNDAEGRGAKDRLVKSWLARYKDAKAMPLTLADASASIQSDAAIEDIFPEKYYVDAVLKVYGKQLPESANGKLELEKGGLLAKRVEAALGKHNIVFNKGRVAKVICNEIRSMKKMDELPGDTAKIATEMLESLSIALEDTAS